MIGSFGRGSRPSRLAAALPAVVAAAILGVGAVPVLAHGPDPLLGSATWGRDQVVPFQWSPVAVPPKWMADAIDAGATDVAESRDSRAAVFVRFEILRAGLDRRCLDVCLRCRR